MGKCQVVFYLFLHLLDWMLPTRWNTKKEFDRLFLDFNSFYNFIWNWHSLCVQTQSYLNWGWLGSDSQPLGGSKQSCWWLENVCADFLPQLIENSWVESTAKSIKTFIKRDSELQSPGIQTGTKFTKKINQTKLLHFHFYAIKITCNHWT